MVVLYGVENCYINKFVKCATADRVRLNTRIPSLDWHGNALGVFVQGN